MNADLRTTIELAKAERRQRMRQEFLGPSDWQRAQRMQLAVERAIANARADKLDRDELAVATGDYWS